MNLMSKKIGLLIEEWEHKKDCKVCGSQIDDSYFYLYLKLSKLHVKSHKRVHTQTLRHQSFIQIEEFTETPDQKFIGRLSRCHL
jgi:hypothetical protein